MGEKDITIAMIWAKIDMFDGACADKLLFHDEILKKSFKSKDMLVKPSKKSYQWN